MEPSPAPAPPDAPREKTIFRSQQRDNFTILPNALLQDKTLSFRARGLLAFMLSLPEQWHTYQDWLQRQTVEGRVAIRSAIEELMQAGYVTRRPGRDENGLMKGHVWNWHAVPLPPEQRSSLRKASSRLAVNPPGGESAAIKNSGNKEPTSEMTKKEQAPSRVSKGTPLDGAAPFLEGRLIGEPGSRSWPGFLRQPVVSHSRSLTNCCPGTGSLKYPNTGPTSMTNSAGTSGISGGKTWASGCPSVIWPPNLARLMQRSPRPRTISANQRAGDAGIALALRKGGKLPKMTTALSDLRHRRAGLAKEADREMLQGGKSMAHTSIR